MSTQEKQSFFRDPIVQGEVLLSIAQGKFRNDDVMLAAKVFMRNMLSPLLGKRPLMSRDLLYPC